VREPLSAPLRVYRAVLCLKNVAADGAGVTPVYPLLPHSRRFSLALTAALAARERDYMSRQRGQT
jgi:hypothetical protein